MDFVYFKTKKVLTINELFETFKLYNPSRLSHFAHKTLAYPMGTERIYCLSLTCGVIDAYVERDSFDFAGFRSRIRGYIVKELTVKKIIKYNKDKL